MSRYTIVPSTETYEDSEENKSSPKKGSGHVPEPTRQILAVLCSLFCLFFGIIIGVILTVYLTHRSLSASNYLSTIAERSPITPEVGLRFHNQPFNGSLLKENVYRRPAGDEVDRAWQALGVDYRSVIVPTKLASKVGFAYDQVRVSDKYGGGYLANIEGLHQLHCLNLLRQTLWFNYDHYHAKGEGAFKNNDFVLQKHTTHCIDIIRQQLMCSVDIGVLGQVWWQSSTMAYPAAYTDFNTRHVCRNFDDVRAWAEKHQVPEEPPIDFLEPPRPGDKIYNQIP